jgi:hypothetical protein
MRGSPMLATSALAFARNRRDVRPAGPEADVIDVFLKLSRAVVEHCTAALLHARVS